MPNKKIVIGLIIVICFQLFIHAGVYLNAVYPIWTGQVIKLKTMPVDPRSLFRGNYARLRYTISNIPARDINRLTSPRHGEIVYVKLKPSTSGVWDYNGVSLKKPNSAPFLRGRIQTSYHRTPNTYRIFYGIEAYFAPKKKALELEKKLRQNAVATIKVAKNGKAALQEVNDGSI